MAEEHWSSVPGVARLTERNFDVSDFILQESPCSPWPAFGVVGGESAGKHTRPQEEGTRFLLGLGKVDGVDACPLELDRVEEAEDFLAYLVSHA